MHPAYVYTPSIWPPLGAAIFLAALGFHGWRRRGVPGALALLAGSLFSALWVLGIAWEVTAVAPATKIAWHEFQAVWQLPAVSAGTCFVLEYTYPGRWPTRCNRVLLALSVLLSVLLIVTNDARLVWSSVQVGPDGTVLAHYATAGRILLFFGLGLILVNLVAFAWLFFRSPQHRWPVALMLLGQIAGRAGYLLGVVSPLEVAWPGTTIASIVLPWMMYAIALFGFRIFDPISLARQTAIEKLSAGLLALDLQGRVVSLNPAAEHILRAPASRAKGQPIKELLPTYPDGPLADPGTTEIELTLEAGHEVRYYRLAISLLRDWRRLEVGRLLMLRDVTEQKRAQAQILEQQRALVSLRERERLARELHDGIGQVLGYASFQTQAASQLITNGQIPVAQAQLARLASVLREAHADVRQQILDLSAAPSPQRPFCAVVQQYLDGFTSNYDIQTGLTVSGELEGALTPEGQLQLLRILQEALSNARRHGQARHVAVTLDGKNGAIRMSIRDDGHGFDLHQAAAMGGNHFGLVFMRERAAELGGSLCVESVPERGTSVVVEVPAKESGDACASGG